MLITAGMLLLAVANVASMDENHIRLPNVAMEWLTKGIMFYGIWYYRALGGPFIEIKDDGYRLVAKVEDRVIGIFIDNKIYAIYTKDKRQIFLREYGTTYTHDHRITSSYLPLFAVYNPLNPHARSFTPPTLHLNQVAPGSTPGAIGPFWPNRIDPEIIGPPRPNRVDPGVIGPPRLNRVDPGVIGRPRTNRVDPGVIGPPRPNRVDPGVIGPPRPNRVDPGVIGPPRPNRGTPGGRILRSPNQAFPGESSEK